MNAMQAIKEGNLPYNIRSGFYIFLESERIRHLNDAKKIVLMQKELQDMTPSFTKEVVNSFNIVAKRFIDFSFERDCLGLKRREK